MPTREGYRPIHVHVKEEIRTKLEEIRRHHVARGNDHMSFAKIVSDAITREHRRLNLEK